MKINRQLNDTGRKKEKRVFSIPEKNALFTILVLKEVCSQNSYEHTVVRLNCSDEDMKTHLDHKFPSCQASIEQSLRFDPQPEK